LTWVIFVRLLPPIFPPRDIGFCKTLLAILSSDWVHITSLCSPKNAVFSTEPLSYDSSHENRAHQHVSISALGLSTSDNSNHPARDALQSLRRVFYDYPLFPFQSSDSK